MTYNSKALANYLTCTTGFNAKAFGDKVKVFAGDKWVAVSVLPPKYFK